MSRTPEVPGGLLVALLMVCPAAAAAESSNLRPFFAVGYAQPVGFGTLDNGFGLGFGLEAETSARATALFRMDWSWLSGEEIHEPYFYDSRSQRRNLINWGIGPRVYLSQGGIRSYSELLLGARFVGDPSSAGGFGDSSGGQISDQDSGLAATVRLGLSTARRGGAGFFLDVGYEFPFENPDRGAVVPVHLGVLFP